MKPWILFVLLSSIVFATGCGSDHAVIINTDNITYFAGMVSEVNNGCTYDAECFAVIAGKKVIYGSGAQTENQWGSVIGELEIGKIAEVYAAQKKGFYTLEGSSIYYIKTE